VDTSCLVAIAFDEPGTVRLARRLESFDRRFSSNLLEAELRSALAREKEKSSPTSLLSRITWVYPMRPLTPELETAAAHGYLRGADLWHVACALFLSPQARELHFLSLDKRQSSVAARVGFRV